MHSELHLHYQFNDKRQLAHCVIDRFEQLVILLPTHCDDGRYSEADAGDLDVSLGAKLLVSVKLPDATEQAAHMTAIVRCIIKPTSINYGSIWVGITLIDDNEFDVEQRIRRLTHDSSHEYGRILAEVFA